MTSMSMVVTPPEHPIEGHAPFSWVRRFQLRLEFGLLGPRSKGARVLFLPLA